MKKLCLNLGSGLIHKKSTEDTEWINIDIQEPANLLLDLNKDKLPYDDNSVDYIYSRSTFEHLADITNIMTECFRVLKPGGILKVIAPYFRWSLTYQPMHKLYFNITSFDGFTKANDRMRYPVRFKLKSVEFAKFPDKWAWLCKWIVKNNIWIYQNVVAVFFPAKWILFEMVK